MAFDFKATPALGDTFEDTKSGAAYTWVGEKWWRTKSATIPDPTTPILTSLNPSTVGTGSPNPVPVRATGENFTASSVVQVDGTAVPTTFVSATVLSFSYQITQVKVASVIVVNGAKSSAALPLTITAVPLASLFISTITPPSAAWSAGNAFVVITGGVFVTGGSNRTSVLQNGVGVIETIVSSALLNATLIAPSAPRVDQISLTDPNGETSAPHPFTWT